MKKQLPSTSALVAAGMIAAATGTPTTAQAQQTAQAPASSPITVQVGGYMRQFAGWYDSQDRRAASPAAGPTGTAKSPSVGVKSDTEIYFQGKTTLANGISVSMRVELEGNTSNDMIDESFAAVEGAFGRIEIGSTDAAGTKTLIGSPTPVLGIGNYNAPGNFGANTLRLYTSTTGNASVAAGMQLQDDDAEKISYYTPRFEGFQLGLTYTPRIAQDTNSAAIANLDSGVASNYQHGFGAGLNFTRAFGAVDVAASAGYYKLKKPTNDADLNTTTLSDPEAYSFGLQVGYAGFRVGGAYGAMKDQWVEAGLTPGNNNVGPSFVNNLNSGKIYELGVTYTFGPAVIGANYNYGVFAASNALPNDESYKIYSVSGRYTLGPGVDVQAYVFHSEMKGEGTALTNGIDLDNNKITGVITGLILSF